MSHVSTKLACLFQLFDLPARFSPGSETAVDMADRGESHLGYSRRCQSGAPTPAAVENKFLAR